MKCISSRHGTPMHSSDSCRHVLSTVQKSFRDVKVGLRGIHRRASPQGAIWTFRDVPIAPFVEVLLEEATSVYLRTEVQSSMSSL